MISEPTDNVFAALRDYVALTKQRESYKRSLADIEKQLAALERPLLENLASAGIDKTTISGTTVYTGDFSWVEIAGDEAALCDALEDYGYEHVVTGRRINKVRAATLIKELQEAGEDLPKAIADLLVLQTRPRLKTRNAS